MTDETPSRDRHSHFFREPIAIILWAYAIIKLLVFDIDTYLLGLIAPGSEWILNLRFIAIAGLLAVLWLILGYTRFLTSIAYIIAYPLIVVFWKIPKLIWRRWVTFLILLPTIYTTLISFRSTFVLYTGAAISTVLIAFGERQLLLVPAMAYLSFFLAVMLYRAFKRAHSSSVFSQLASLIRKTHSKITSGQYDQLPIQSTAAPASIDTEPEYPADYPQVPQLYMLHVAAEFIAQKVDEVARDRRYNALLAVSLLSVIVLTTIVFALLNWSLFRMDPQSFSGVAGNGFLHFLAYSLGRLANSNLTSIQPRSTGATMVAAAEVFCSILIIVIGGFSFFTARRDTYREDFQDFDQALHETASVIDRRIGTKYSLTAAELEIRVAERSTQVVNFLRRIRGLPEIDYLGNEGGSPLNPPEEGSRT